MSQNPLQEVELYAFASSSAQFTLTPHEFDVDLDGDRYLSLPMQRNELALGAESAKSALELKLPKIAMKTEEYTGAGMLGPVKLLKAIEAIEIEHTYNGPIREIVADFGAEKHDASLLRFMGSYSEEGTGTDQAVEIIVRGRHNEFDQGEAKGEHADHHRQQASDQTAVVQGFAHGRAPTSLPAGC